MRVRNLILCCLLYISLVPAKVIACSCTNESEVAHRARGDLIFVGTAVSVQESATRFVVEKTLKGQGEGEVVVSTPEADNSCYTTFAEGATYIVSARRRSGELYTDYCSGNALVRSAEENNARVNPVDNAGPVSASAGGRSWGLTYTIGAGSVLALIMALGIGVWLLVRRRAA